MSIIAEGFPSSKYTNLLKKSQIRAKNKSTIGIEEEISVGMAAFPNQYQSYELD